MSGQSAFLKRMPKRPTELADLYQQAADILAEKGPEGDLQVVFAELNTLTPQINAAAQTLGVEDCLGD